MDREKTWGGVAPHYPTRGQGGVVSCPSGIRAGSSPGRKWILCIFEVRKLPSETPFSVFFELWRGPLNVAGPGKTFPHYPSRGPVQIHLSTPDFSADPPPREGRPQASVIPVRPVGVDWPLHGQSQQELHSDEVCDRMTGQATQEIEARLPSWTSHNGAALCIKERS